VGVAGEEDDADWVLSGGGVGEEGEEVGARGGRVSGWEVSVRWSLR